jgi:polyferredoxin
VNIFLKLGTSLILSLLQSSEVLPFDYSFGIPMILFWIQVFLFSTILIEAKLMDKKISLAFYIITITYAGILLGGQSNVINPIHQFLLTLGSDGDFTYLIPALIIFCIILITSFLVGRMFCAFACPIGAVQELFSKINFKFDINNQANFGKHVDVSIQLASRIRWLFFAAFVIFAGVWSIQLLPFVNPFSAFLILQKPAVFLISLSFIFLLVVSLVSVFLYRPYCRFICPFGAVSSLLSKYTRNKYERTEVCTECGLCEKICPTLEAFQDSKKNECYYCNRCIEICPVDAIQLNLG